VPAPGRRVLLGLYRLLLCNEPPQYCVLQLHCTAAVRGGHGAVQAGPAAACIRQVRGGAGQGACQDQGTPARPPACPPARPPACVRLPPIGLGLPPIAPNSLLYCLQVGGLATLQKAIILDSSGQSAEAQKLYKRIANHAVAQVARKAKQMLFGFEVGSRCGAGEVRSATPTTTRGLRPPPQLRSCCACCAAAVLLLVCAVLVAMTCRLWRAAGARAWNR
jgi:hypothetical protein